MPEIPLPLQPTAPSQTDRLFPTLTAAQIARIAAHGRRRAIEQGEVLIEVGDKAVPFFVVVRGAIEIVNPSGSTEKLILRHRAGQFLGEGNMLTGRRALMRAHVTESGEVIEVDSRQLLALVQTDTELSEILMRAFILRRLELIARGYGDVVLIGSTHCAGTLRIKEFLTRNGQPHAYVAVDVDHGAQARLAWFDITPGSFPVLFCRGMCMLR